MSRSTDPTEIMEDGLGTYTYFGLVPVGGMINLSSPTIKTNYVDIPGGPGSIDFTNALTPWTNYNDVEGTIEFYMLSQVETDSRDPDTIPQDDPAYTAQTEHGSLSDRVCNIAHFLHINELNGMMTFVPMWTVEDLTFMLRGRMWVDSWDQNDNGIPTITLGYRFKPFMDDLYPRELLLRAQGLAWTDVTDQILGCATPEINIFPIVPSTFQFITSTDDTKIRLSVRNDNTYGQSIIFEQTGGNVQYDKADVDRYLSMYGYGEGSEYKIDAYNPYNPGEEKTAYLKIGFRNRLLLRI